MIVLQVAGTVAHRMAVFAEYERAALLLILQELTHILRRRVHLRNQVKDIVRGVVELMGAFVMQQARIVQGFHQLPGCTHVRPPAAFVSKRPEYHAGTVYIALYQALGAVGYRLFEHFVGSQ